MNEQELTILGIACFFWITTALIIVFGFFRHKNKIKVNVITSLGKIVKWISPKFEGSKVILLIRKAKEKGRNQCSEWKAEVTPSSIVDYFYAFRRRKEVYILPEAMQTISFITPEGEVKMPRYDKETWQAWLNSQVIKKRGEGTKPPIPQWILYATLLIGAIGAFIALLTYLKLGSLM